MKTVNSEKALQNFTCKHFIHQDIQHTDILNFSYIIIGLHRAVNFLKSLVSSIFKPTIDHINGTELTRSRDTESERKRREEGGGGEGVR